MALLPLELTAEPPFIPQPARSADATIAVPAKINAWVASRVDIGDDVICMIHFLLKSAYCAVKGRVTEVPALKFVSPACDAVMLTGPVPVMVSVLPLIEAGPLATVKVTGRPLVATATRVTLVPWAKFAKGGKRMLWAAPPFTVNVPFVRLKM
jgi:hypothetical protein